MLAEAMPIKIQSLLLNTDDSVDIKPLREPRTNFSATGPVITFGAVLLCSVSRLASAGHLVVDQA